MEWRHSAEMSTAEAGTAVVVLGDDGWEALPFGLEGEAAEVFPRANRPSRSSRAWRATWRAASVIWPRTRTDRLGFFMVAHLP